MSKGLEALKDIRECLFWSNKGLKKIDIIEKELKELEERREMMKRFNEACVPMILDNKTEKSLKALEIIKKKKVNVRRLFECKTLDEYNDSLQIRIIYRLTEEEYNLLKEVLL